MTKAFKVYLTCWTVIFILFNLIYFLIGKGTIIDKYTITFWISYAFIVVAFLGQLICGYIALNKNNLQKMFYNIPLVSICYSGMIAMLIIAGICRLVPVIPYWVAIILCSIVLVITFVAVLKAKLGADLVESVDNKIKSKTLFIKLLTVDAEALMGKATSGDMKSECKKVYEKIRYSDPMSHDALAGIESEISTKLQELQLLVTKNDLDAVKKAAKEIILLIDERNSKCKVLKSM